MIAERISDFIPFPNSNELMSLAAGLDFPYAIGVIDTTDIVIKQPLATMAAYTTRHDYTAIKVQGVCDSRYRFIDVSIGWPASMHDARIWRMSHLSQVIEDRLAATPYFIVGDSAYPLSLRMMTPYRDNGHLSNLQKSYNRQLSAQRSVIERAFALLKGKWRKLLFVNVTNLSYIPHILAAACVLHNFVVDAEEERIDDDNVQQPPPFEFTNDARINRINISNLL